MKINLSLLGRSIIVSGLMLSNVVIASPDLWKDRDVSPSFANKQQLAEFSAKAEASPLVSRALELNKAELKKQLGIAVTNLSAKHLNNILPEITIPLPDGGEVRVIAEQSATMAPELAKRFPQITTWRVTGLDDARIRGRIDMTEQGFHAMLVMPDGDTIFVEPDNRAAERLTSDQYINFSKRSNLNAFKTDFQCAVHTEQSSPVAATRSLQSGKPLQARAAPQKITYRLAVATTGEYTQFHGGTKGKALSAVVTTINRVNEIYERDLGITLELIDREEDLIYTNPATDPYTNDDVNALIDENISNLNRILRSSEYDIGHIFGQGDVGGLAHVESICDRDTKAGGVTGIDSPHGDVFSVDFVAHEIGHQLGGTHTYNSFCFGGSQRNSATAVEPGSGTTIMGYAGVCDGNNIQDHSDPQFHAVSIFQITEALYSGGGSSCGIRKSAFNEIPRIDAGSDITVPSSTPFMLIASGRDSDGDRISFVWEQSDTGSPSDMNVDTGDNAIFRSRPASYTGVRFIPRLQDLFSGRRVNGERLPVEDRKVTFVATARDGRGATSLDEKTVTVRSTGRSFEVTSHRSRKTFYPGDKTTLRWDIAGTARAPINCRNVDIYLLESDRKGVYFGKTSNDGRATLALSESIPAMSNARFMVACSTRSFFNVSLGRLTVRGENRSLGNVIVGGNEAGGKIVNDNDGSTQIGLFTWLIYPLFLIAFYRNRRKIVKQ